MRTPWAWLAAVVAGCALFCVTARASVRSDVTAFHNLSAQKPLTGSVYIQPGEGAERGLEFQSYAQEAAKGFARHGLTQAPSAKAADYTATLSYSISSGEEILHSPPNPNSVIHGSVGSAKYASSPMAPPIYGIAGYHSSGVVTIYKRVASIKLTDRRKGQEIWLCRATSSGHRQEIAEVLPAMIRSILQDFPGQPGKTQVVVESLD
jgi:hypothetical protein